MSPRSGAAGKSDRVSSSDWIRCNLGSDLIYQVATAISDEAHQISRCFGLSRKIQWIAHILVTECECRY